MMPYYALDLLLFGWMAPVMVAGGYFAAMRAADRAGVSLAVYDGFVSARV